MKHAHAKTGEEGAQLCTPECKTKSHLYSYSCCLCVIIITYRDLLRICFTAAVSIQQTIFQKWFRLQIFELRVVSVWSDPQVYLVKVDSEQHRQINRALQYIFVSVQVSLHQKHLLTFLYFSLLYTVYTCSCFNTFTCRCAPAVTFPHCNTVQPFLPIHTSPNWPLPSFLISWRDSRGISHISLVFTDKSASLGMPRLQLPIKRQHSPAALSEREQRRTRRRRKKETREK